MEAWHPSEGRWREVLDGMRVGGWRLLEGYGVGVVENVYFCGKMMK